MSLDKITKNQNMEKKNTKLCYVDIYDFIVYLETVDIYLDIAKDVETRFYTYYL